MLVCFASKQKYLHIILLKVIEKCWRQNWKIMIGLYRTNNNETLTKLLIKNVGKHLSRSSANRRLSLQIPPAPGQNGKKVTKITIK